jgi:hypothetical protein
VQSLRLALIDQQNSRHRELATALTGGNATLWADNGEALTAKRDSVLQLLSGGANAIGAAATMASKVRSLLI